MKLNGRCACGMARSQRCVCTAEARAADRDSVERALDRRNELRRRRHAELRAREGGRQA
jgi:hypothetical protein